jgi:GH25 family lysozyme M1 (1,4-beta-N-acetylmuramidase)
MGQNTATQITNEMLMEQLMEMKSMIMNLQSEMESLKNQMGKYFRRHGDASCESQNNRQLHQSGQAHPHSDWKAKLLHHHPGKGIDVYASNS